MIRTMRHIWDEQRRNAKSQNEAEVVPRRRRTFNEKDVEGLAKQRKYFLEHVKRKKMVMDFFPAYGRYLGNAGFAKIFNSQFNKKVEK